MVIRCKAGNSKRNSKFSLFMLIVIFFVLYGCDEEAMIDTLKLDAEEAGYYIEYKEILDNGKAILPLLYIDIVKLKAFEELEDTQQASATQTAISAQLDKIKGFCDKYLQGLEKTLPPKEFKNFHHRFIDFLKKIQTTNDLEEIRKHCLAFSKVTKNLIEKIDNREVNESIAKSTLVISYKPPISPVGIQLSDDGFDVNINVDTPVGQVAFSEKDPQGVKRLVIISGGLSRFFSLDRPFEVVIPENLGFTVTSDTISVIITVIEKK